MEVVEAEPVRSAGHLLWFRDPCSGSLCELVNASPGIGRAPVSNAIDTLTGSRALRWEGPEHQRAYIVSRFKACEVLFAQREGSAG